MGHTLFCGNYSKKKRITPMKIKLKMRQKLSHFKNFLQFSFEFRKFIKDNTGYKDAGIFSSTDITVLCEKICGVNLSLGYYDEHTKLESFKFNEWLNTLNIARKMLAPKQKKFPLAKDFNHD